MSHLNEDDASYSPSKKKVWTFGGIVVMVIAIAVGKGLGRAGADYGIDTYQRHEAVAQVDTYMEKGDLAPFYHALQDVDPDRAAQFKAKIKSIIQEAPTRQNANEQMFYYARGALADYRKAALKASDESVREVAQSRLNLMRAVRADLGQAECARMAVSGPWPGMPNPPSVKRAVFDASTILVRAGAEGMRSPVTRPEPSQAVLNRWTEGVLAAGITESELNALGSGDLASLSTARQCNMTITLFEVSLKVDSAPLWQMLITEG